MIIRERLAYVVPLGIPYSTFLTWPETDQDLALAWRRWQQEACAGCGTRAEEWKQDRDAWVGSTRVCEGCARLEREQDNVPEGERGVKIGLARPGHDTIAGGER